MYLETIEEIKMLIRSCEVTYVRDRRWTVELIDFLERPTLEELQMDKPVLPEIEQLREKVTDKQLEAIKDVLDRNQDVFSRHKADIGCCNFVDHEKELEELAVSHREGARCMTPKKSDACRKEIETLLEYDRIEPSKSP